MRRLLVPAALALSAPATATPSPPPPPKLLILLSVDQLSADLFSEYRTQWRGGIARLAGGVVYANGYHGHAATETCPGHAAIATGVQPARNGIIANGWMDFAAPRDDKNIYCAEDEAAAAPSGQRHSLSTAHLDAPTLGDRLKRQSPASRVVSIAGKDRAAVMLGGRSADHVLYLDGARFASLKTPVLPSLAAVNAAIAAQVATAEPALAPTPFCAAKARSIAVPGGSSVGAGAFARNAGDDAGWKTSPASDGATLALAAAAIRDLGLGQRTATDLLAISLSATDFVGHTYGSGGQEMCLQLHSLDRDLGDFFARLDSWSVDYAVALTSDHGMADIPERRRLAGVAAAERIAESLTAARIGAAVRATTGLGGAILEGDDVIGDLYLDPALKGADRGRALAALVAEFRRDRQVEAAFTKAEIAATALPAGDPRRWSLIERVRASFDARRSGDLYVILKESVSPNRGTGDSVASHGSPWDHDRKVPILLWRKGVIGADRPEAATTVDIVPTLAALVGVPLEPGAVDGRCLDGLPGVACPPR